uniref:Uncharacterized protein n=1 Tax=Eutreptiella gymnastica TaxID=73025 RepID=A0A7S4GN30_9EUGL
MNTRGGTLKWTEGDGHPEAGTAGVWAVCLPKLMPPHLRASLCWWCGHHREIFSMLDVMRRHTDGHRSIRNQHLRHYTDSRKHTIPWAWVEQCLDGSGPNAG